MRRKTGDRNLNDGDFHCEFPSAVLVSHACATFVQVHVLNPVGLDYLVLGVTHPGFLVHRRLRTLISS